MLILLLLNNNLSSDWIYLRYDNYTFTSRCPQNSSWKTPTRRIPPRWVPSPRKSPTWWIVTHILFSIFSLHIDWWYKQGYQKISQIKFRDFTRVLLTKICKIPWIFIKAIGVTSCRNGHFSTHENDKKHSHTYTRQTRSAQLIKWLESSLGCPPYGWRIFWQLLALNG